MLFTRKTQMFNFVLQGRVETLFTWGGKRLHFCTTNLLRTICTKFCHNRSGFVDCISNNILVCFWFTVYIFDNNKHRCFASDSWNCVAVVIYNNWTLMSELRSSLYDWQWKYQHSFAPRRHYYYLISTVDFKGVRSIPLCLTWTQNHYT